MMVWHLLLGRPWQYDQGAIHNGHTNFYIFKWKNKEYILWPMMPSQIIAENALKLARPQNRKKKVRRVVRE